MTTQTHLIECPCGAQHAYDRECTHNNEAEPYHVRYRYPDSGEEGTEEGVIGPEGNRIPLFRTIFEATGTRIDWFDSAGRAHIGHFVPYPEL